MLLLTSSCTCCSLPKEVDGKHVAIVDFSFDAETMADLKARTTSFIVRTVHGSRILRVECTVRVKRVSEEVVKSVVTSSVIKSAVTVGLVNS